MVPLVISSRGPLVWNWQVWAPQWHVFGISPDPGYHCMASECPGCWWWLVVLSKNIHGVLVYSTGGGRFLELSLKNLGGFFVLHNSHDNWLMFFQLQCTCISNPSCWNSLPMFDHLDSIHPSLKTQLKHYLHGWGSPPPSPVWVRSPLLGSFPIPYGVWPPHWLFYNLLMTRLSPHINHKPRPWAPKGKRLWFLWLV